MKKIMALVLAVAMMSVVAFAAITNGTNPAIPGKKIVIPYDASLFEESTGAKVATWLSGSTDIKVNGSFVGVGASDVLHTIGSSFNITAKDFNNTNFVVSATWNKASLVESVKIADAYTYSPGSGDIDGSAVDAGAIEIKLRANPTLLASKGETLSGTVTVTEKSTGRTMTLKFSSGAFLVGNLAARTITLNMSESTVLDVTDTDMIINCKGNSSNPYGTLVFPAHGTMAVEISARVYDGDNLSLMNNNDAEKSILIANADLDATVKFLNFDYAQKLNATLRFYGADKEDFVYENVGGKLVVPSGLKYDEEYGVWTLKTGTLGKYVVSDKALVATSAGNTTTGTENPPTGANDVVAVAMALAVVSAVAAGAVSLKK